MAKNHKKSKNLSQSQLAVRIGIGIGLGFILIAVWAVWSGSDVPAVTAAYSGPTMMSAAKKSSSGYDKLPVSNEPYAPYTEGATSSAESTEELIVVRNIGWWQGFDPRTATETPIPLPGTQAKLIYTPWMSEEKMAQIQFAGTTRTLDGDGFPLDTRKVRLAGFARGKVYLQFGPLNE